MLKITKDNREEIENEFMALVLNREDTLDMIQINPKYLHNKKNQVLLEQLLECWKEYHAINVMKILEKHKDFDFEYYTYLLTEVFYHKESWQYQLQMSEESILKFYKEDVIKQQNERLTSGEINYDKFMEQMKKIDEISIIKETETLTIEEMESNLGEKSRIDFRKYPKLNETLKLVEGDFLVIGSTTGNGKSGFLLNLMVDLMSSYQCIYFNMEMSKSTIYTRLISITANVLMASVTNPMSSEIAEKISKAKKKIQDSNIVIEHKATDINEIRSLIKKLKKDDLHTIVFIDHLGLTKSADNKFGLYEQMTEVAKNIRQICLELDCTVIGASQLNRGAYNSEELSISMLKDSGEIENSASKIILLHRQAQEEKEKPIVNIDIEIAKNRDGKTGFIKMVYDKPKQIFNERSD